MTVFVLRGPVLRPRGRINASFCQTRRSLGL